MEIDIDQMSQIIKLFEDSTLTEITVEQDNYRLTLRKEARGDRAGSGGEPVTSVSGKDRSSEALATEEEFEEDDDRFYITSPIVGTFYSSASPDDAPYVQVGDVVHEGETVCIVEAMKVMNEVKANKDGEVVEVCVEDGDPVEYGQELFILMPSDKVS